ncbi:MAG: GGDEF domain-containing protein [Treponema sp.]|nr:GGDEF domain-containing protein [Treponema sp.]
MEYNYERYHLNSFCKFIDKHIESEFMEYEKTASLNIVRFMMLLYGIIFILFAYSDYYFYGGGKTFYVTLGLRSIALVITVIAFFFAGTIKQYKHTLQLVSFTELAIFVIYLLNLYNLRAHEYSLQFMSVMIFILAVFLIPNLWRNCLITGTVILALYIIYSIIFRKAGESPSALQRSIYLGICLVSCAIFIYGREKSRRRQFASEKLLEFMTITDRLTGIYNRNRFEFMLGLWIKNMRHDPFCLVLFDIDDFKAINDTYGHNTGDQVLMEISEVVSANIRDSDIFARWGGEEFVILFGNTAIEHATDFAERLRKAVEDNPNGKAGKVTISIGVVQYRREKNTMNGESAFDVVDRADVKMYEAKKAGKNRVVAEIVRD